jgi:hypothetical protein
MSVESVGIAVRRRQSRLDPVGARSGGREAEKRGPWGRVAAVCVGVPETGVRLFNIWIITFTMVGRFRLRVNRSQQLNCGPWSLDEG